MQLIIQIAVVVFCLLLLAAVVLRIRKLRRDELRELDARAARPIRPPSSPYAPSRGYRVLGASEDPLESRQGPSRPRLDATHSYVFSDLSSAMSDETTLNPRRHDERWALSRAGRHGATPTQFWLRLLLGLIVLGFVLGISLQLMGHGHRNVAATSTTLKTTTTIAPPTTSTTVARYDVVTRQGNDVTYNIGATRYTVSVSANAGPTWVVFQMGPHQTLEWQGALSQGGTKTLTLTGTGLVTLGSPRDAAVTVNGAPLVWPSPLPSTLLLTLQTPSG